MPKNNGKRGTCEEDLETCMSCGRRGTRDMLIRAARRSGRCFVRAVACGTLHVTWHHFLVAGAALATDGMENRKTHWHEAAS